MWDDTQFAQQRLHWLKFQVTIGDRVEILTAPVWERASESADDYLEGHPSWTRRATESLRDRFGEHAAVEYIGEVFL